MSAKYNFAVLSVKQQHQDMFKFLESEQRALWDQFLKDIDHAANKVWSLGCQNTVDRILENAMLVGPAPWKSITWTAVGSGLWANMWYAAQLVNTPEPIPTVALDEVEDQMSQKGVIEKKTLTYLAGKYQDTRAAMIDYVEKRRKAGAFNVNGEPDPECTCAMTEASFFACEVHGENAKMFLEEVWPEKKSLKTIHCDCGDPKTDHCPVHGPKAIKEDTTACTCSTAWPKTAQLSCPIHGFVAQALVEKPKPLPF